MKITLVRLVLCVRACHRIIHFNKFKYELGNSFTNESIYYINKFKTVLKSQALKNHMTGSVELHCYVKQKEQAWLINVVVLVELSIKMMFRM